MGLAVDAWEFVEKLDETEAKGWGDDDDLDEAGFILARIADDNVALLEPLERGKWYGYTTGVGCGFYAGSYEAYNEWLEFLSQIVHGVHPRQVRETRDPMEGEPFVELIRLRAYAEATFGETASAKLAGDFEAQREKVLARAPDVIEDEGLQDWFMTVYDGFADAFKVGARAGLVEFH